MRYISDPNPNKALFKISEECFNIEARKQYFRNNELLDSTTGIKIPTYPSFIIDDTKVMMGLSFGFIFIPQKIIDTFPVDFRSSMLNISGTFQKKYGFDHLQTYSTLETGNDHFTMLKVKNNIGGTYFTEDIYDNCERHIHVNTTCNKIDHPIGHARFTWIIYTLEQFMIDLTNYNNRKIPLIAQLMGVFYDPKKYLNLVDGELRISNVTFKDFAACKSILNLCCYGRIDEMFMKKYSDTTNSSILSLLSLINLESKKPEFLPGWYNLDTTIKICNKRKAGFEIIRHFGNISIYQGFTFVQILPITMQIFVVQYGEVNILNDKCGKCDTLLYDDVYLSFSNCNSVVCTAYCPICMHAQFDATTGLYTNANGTLLYNDSIVLARTKYPVTAESLINKMDVDIIVKNILSRIQTDPTYESDDCLYKPIFIERSKTEKYLGWNGDLFQYVTLMHDNVSNGDYEIFQYSHISF